MKSRIIFIKFYLSRISSVIDCYIEIITEVRVRCTDKSLLQVIKSVITEINNKRIKLFDGLVSKLKFSF